MTDGDEIPTLPAYVNVGHRYARAPIVEAAIDLRVDFEDGISDQDLLGRLASVYPVGPDEFESPEPLHTFSNLTAVNTGDSIVGRAPAKQVGYTFRRESGDAVVRANIDRYVYSRLAAYTEWSEFLSDAEGYWASYRDVMKPYSVSAIGVRFVNRIVVRKELVEMKDYLRVGADVPPYLPQWTTGYFLQIGVPLEDFQSEAVITTALVDPEEDEQGCAVLILDIDVRTASSLDVAAQDFDARLLGKLEKLRVAKNFVFEACITDATRGLIS